MPLVHKHVLALLNGYIKVPAITGTISSLFARNYCVCAFPHRARGLWRAYTESGIGNYITLSPFGGNAGLVGACELARLALPHNASPAM